MNKFFLNLILQNLKIQKQLNYKFNIKQQIISKMKVKGFLSLVCLCALVVCAESIIIKYETVEQREGGEWSQIIMAEQFGMQPYDTPSQYFLCGFAFRKLLWEKVINNCLCKRKFYRWRLQTICKPCPNKLDTQTSGAKGIFCRTTNWNDQILKIFQKNSNNALSWRQDVMCPQNHFVNGIIGYFPSESNIELGLIDLKLSCSTTALDSTVVVKGRQFNGHPNSHKGLFVSSFNIKHSNNNLVGIKVNYQYEAVISHIKINYELNQKPIQQKVKIAEETLINYSNKLVSRTVSIEKFIENICSWNIKDKYLLGYYRTKNFTIELPSSSPSTQSKLEEDSLRLFKFNENFIISSKYSNNIVVVAESCSKVMLTCQMIYSKQKIPFRAQMILSERISGKTIKKIDLEGTWEGKINRSTIENINEEKLENEQCEKNNLRV